MTPTAGRPGERSAAEIERLKRDLEREQDRVSTLSRDLSANVSKNLSVRYRRARITAKYLQTEKREGMKMLDLRI